MTITKLSVRATLLGPKVAFDHFVLIVSFIRHSIVAFLFAAMLRDNLALAHPWLVFRIYKSL
jgi:hypothetical protein